MPRAFYTLSLLVLTIGSRWPLHGTDEVCSGVWRFDWPQIPGNCKQRPWFKFTCYLIMSFLNFYNLSQRKLICLFTKYSHLLNENIFIGWTESFIFSYCFPSSLFNGPFLLHLNNFSGESYSFPIILKKQKHLLVTFGHQKCLI